MRISDLYEAFDSALELEPNSNAVATYKKAIPGISNVSVFDAEISGVKLEFFFAQFKHAWEAHFNNLTANGSLEVGGVLNNSGLTRIIATVMKFFEDKLKAGERIRYYAADPKMGRVYDRAFMHLNKTKFDGKLTVVTDDKFIGIDGDQRQARVLRLRK